MNTGINPTTGNCMECGVRIPTEEEWFFTVTGMCSGCREEEQKRDGIEWQHDELREVINGVNC
jgi:hypothetical protein